MDRVNFYAVVLDASSPYFNEGLCRHLCTIKLIDRTVHPNNPSKSGPAFLTMTCFGHSTKNIPQPATMGAILRVHRGEIKKHANRYQVNCDADIKAAWALFDPTESYVPLRHKGLTYTFVPDDKKRLDDLREFAQDFFIRHDVMPLLSSIKKHPKDCDMLCTVLDREVGPICDKVRAYDGGKFYKLTIPRSRFPYLKPQAVYYIRGMTVVQGKCQIGDLTGILRVPANYMIASKLDKKNCAQDVQF
eukprot:TRINITY_DN1588_c0_g2_i2.p1 TRINITY_DN1588_c0_g2~~TRINITY_DN1588_c0_g2_i2.p1  ORF type:complete len:256 (-),score=17.02 TRINITY_DN1588_c0_g2_i2:3-740(-)